MAIKTKEDLAKAIKKINPEKALIVMEALGTIIALAPQSRLAVRVVTSLLAVTSRILREQTVNKRNRKDALPLEEGVSNKGEENAHGNREKANITQ